MRLPPMGMLGSLGGSNPLAPLGSGQGQGQGQGQGSLGIAIAEGGGAGPAMSMLLNPGPAALGGIPLGSGSQSLASRPIRSAPSAVNGRNSIDGSLGMGAVPDVLAALPPIQSMTPNGKSHKGSSQKLR